MARPEGFPTAPFELGPFRVEPGLDRLVGPAGAVALEPRAMDLLLCLVRHAPETVTKEQLLQEVWQGAFVVEAVIPKTIFALRQALGDDAAAPRFVLTVPRRGYRLLVPALPLAPASPPRAAAPTPRPAASPVVEPAGRAAPRAGRPRRILLWRLAAGALALSALALALRGRGDREAPAAAESAAVERLAVAPFEPIGADPQTAALAVALRAETVGELVRFARPRVLLLEPAAVAARGADTTAREAGADALLTASVERDAQRVRVDVQLVDAPTRELRWTASFERPPGELIHLRRSIASEVAVRFGLAAREPAPPESAAPAPPPIGGDVYRSFLEARYLWSGRDEVEVGRARALFESVTRRAPRFGEGFAWLALAEVTAANYVGGDPVASLAAGEVAARRALELAPDDPVAHAAAGLVALNQKLDPGAAIAHYRRAVALAPSFATARHYLAEALAVAGRFDEAVAAADEAVALEPLSPVLQGVRGLVLHAAGRDREAVEAFDRALVLEPRFFWVRTYRAHALLRLGDLEAAARAFVDAAAAPGEEPVELDRLRAALARDPRRGYWTWWLGRLAVVQARGFRLRPAQLAEALAGAGRGREALDALERSPAAGDGEYFLYARWSPAFDALRADPRFIACYARLAP